MADTITKWSVLGFVVKKKNRKTVKQQITASGWIEKFDCDFL